MRGTAAWPKAIETKISAAYQPCGLAKDFDGFFVDSCNFACKSFLKVHIQS